MIIWTLLDNFTADGEEEGGGGGGEFMRGLLRDKCPGLM